MDTNVLILLKGLISQGGMIAFFSLIISRAGLFRKILHKSRMSVMDKILVIIFFAGIGILGTYTGIPVRGALANTRIVGVFVGGLIGGPLVGICSGILAGIHRWAIDIGGFTAVSCMISTIAEGCLAALLWKGFQKSRNKWLFAGLAGGAAEILQMVIILLTARPFPDAVELVKIIGLPMILGNAAGISMFIAIAESLYRETEKVAAEHSQKVLKIAQETLPFFQIGFNQETATETARIILKYLKPAAVSFTDTTHCLSHVGLGSDHHKPGTPLKTSLTKKAIQEGEHRIAVLKSEIDCEDPECPLKSAIIVPIKSGRETIGVLKLYRERENAITEVDVEVVSGLASLLALQIEISKLEEQSRLLAKAELRALQSQINPHFLFNAINTVSSFIRTKPEKARELLLDLSDYYRFRLHEPEEYIPLSRELEHVKAYLDIEEARFGEKLKVIFSGKTTLVCPVPPLILQPLVENAVKHGIQKSINGGTVEVSMKTEGRSVIITVTDNGVGIAPERLATLIDGEKGSIGLTNVHNRLINGFGPDYGLNIESTLGEGTRIWMKIPCE
ncbi:MAG: sensor histidine kinase [Spirochaetales bacterium]|nr:sensor histidine kinase [Spirochaetales bacterium]